MSTNALFSTTSQMPQLHERMLTSWKKFSQLDTPLLLQHYEDYVQFLRDLAFLQDELFLPVWKSSVNAPIVTLGLLDLNGDGDDELLTITSRGDADHFLDPLSPNYKKLQGGQLPIDALPVIGMQKIHSTLEYASTVYIVTGGNSERPLYKPFYTNSGKVEFDARRSRSVEDRYLTMSQHFGKFESDGLLRLVTVLPAGGQTPRLIGNSFDQEDKRDLPFWPTALVNTANRAWVGNSGERVTSWLWQAGKLLPDPDWPEDGIAVDGRITAMTLWPSPTRTSVEPPPHLLVATDERWLFVIDTANHHTERIPLPQVATAMLSADNGQYLFVAFEDSCLACLEPIHPTLNPSVPTLLAAFNRLQRNDRITIWHRWLQGTDPQLVVAAVTMLATQGAAPQSTLKELIAALAKGKTELPNSKELSDTTRTKVLEGLEKRFSSLISNNGDLSSSMLKIARTWHQNSGPILRRRIDLFTARLVAHFGKDVESSADYKWLRTARRQSDRERAAADLADKRPQQALSLYGKILVERRELNWLFAADGAIRALLPLANDPQVLMATRAGRLHLYDLIQNKQVDWLDLPTGTVPRAMALGSLNGAEKDTLALVTSHGSLFMGPAVPHTCLKSLAMVGQLKGDIWGIAFVPTFPDQPPRLVAGSSSGAVTLYVRRGERQWQTEWHTDRLRVPSPINSHQEAHAQGLNHFPIAKVNNGQSLRAKRLYSLSISIMEPDGPPIIFIGGASVNGQGVLYQLNLAGEVIKEHVFPDTVLDVRTLINPEKSERLIAVACNDGYLYLINAKGTLQWRYQAGRAVHSVTICDIDKDGKQEIIIGGEQETLTNQESVQENTITVLSLKGAVQWVIPAEAPVTHIATIFNKDGRPLLLVADLENTLRGLQVITPRGPQESDICSLANRCLTALSESSGVSEADLINQWCQDAAQPFLQGYTFYHLAKAALQGNGKALTTFLDTDIHSSKDAAQRTYARILVNLAIMPPHDEARMKVAREHLLRLIRYSSTRHPVGVAALRQLMLPDGLKEQRLEDWQPFLKEAASHADQGVRRAVLYALRVFNPIMPEEVDLHPGVWEFLPHFFTAEDNGGTIRLHEDIAALIRDLAGDETSLWVLAHRVFARVADLAAVEDLLESLDYNLLDNNRLAVAVRLLVKLHIATEPKEAGKVLLVLPTSLEKALVNTPSLPAHNTMPRIFRDLYRLLGEATKLRTFDAWKKFVDDNTPSGGLSRLMSLLNNCLIVEDRRFVENLAAIRDRINDFQNEPRPSPDALRRLLDNLRNLAELLSYPSSGLLDSEPLNNILFYRATAGLFWCWFRETGVLQAELERLTQPVSPQLELLEAFRRDDQITLDIRIHNPGYQYAFEDFHLRLDQINLYFQSRAFSCELETFSAQDSLTIEAQSRCDLRLTALVPAAENKRPPAPEATLTFYVDYFLPPKEWQRAKELTVDCLIEDRTHVRLDWESDFPLQAAAATQQIRQALRQQLHQPILVEAPPLIRHGVVAMLRRLPGSGPIVDMRRWRFQQQRLGDSLRANEAAMLAWLAEQLWPQAGRESANIRDAGAPYFAFQQLSIKQRPLPNFIILNNWERLLFQLSRTGNQWQPLEQLLPFLLRWAYENGLRLVFVGTYLMEEMLRTRWPDLFAGFTAIRCDRLDIEQDKERIELVNAIELVLQEETLQVALDHLFPRPTAVWLANWCRGYLHVLDFVCLHALAQAHQTPPLRKTDPQTYLYDFARQNNFYNSLWLWQPFFDRIIVILVAYAEFAIERREWIQVGMTLSRDYYARRQDGRRVPQPTLPTGRTLDIQDATIIRSNQHYQRYDATVRGFILGQHVPEDIPVGRLLQQFLTAGGGRERLDRMVESGILRRRSDRRFGDYYEIGVPFLGRWLRRTNIWQHLQRVLTGQEDSWYPAHIARDQRIDDSPSTHPWLFSEYTPGAAFREIPLAYLPAIDQALTSETRESFYNFYGLSRRGRVTPARRWQALVNLAKQLDQWRRIANAKGDRRQLMEPFFDSLEVLLNVKRLADNLPGVSIIPDDTGVRVFWDMADLFAEELVLQTSILLAVVRRGKDLEKQAVDFRQWARGKMADLHRTQEPDLREAEYVEMMERSVVICLVAKGAEALRRVLPPGRGGPHFIFLDLSQLTAFATDANPTRQLIHHTFNIIGRQPFSPYKLHGSLDKGSDLFVGRRREVNAILGSLEHEDHAILGSRRIGKTSILHQLDYLLNQREPEQRPLTLALHLQDDSKERDFYNGIQAALRGTPYEAWAQELSTRPATSYNDLLVLMQRLYDEHDHPVILLMDEIDGLYLWDKEQNEQRLFQFLRNKLAQPRLCSFVMTGYRYIYLERLKVSSVFHNFCRFHNLLGIEPDGVNQLVSLLHHFDLEIEDREGVVGLIEQGTYGIPYYVQLTCDRLLHRADVLKRKTVAPDDAETILDHDIQKQLKKELWDELLSETHPLDRRLAGSSDEDVRVRNLKIKVLLLATLLELYQHRFQGGIGVKERPVFTAANMIDFVRELCPELCPNPWDVTSDEVHRLMIPVTYTLALAPVESETITETYCFPNDILPDVLYAQQRQRQIDLIDELANLRQELQSALTRH